MDDNLVDFLPTSDLEFYPDLRFQHLSFEVSKKCLCLPIQLESNGERNSVHGKQNSICGLVLERAGSVKGQYSRIGTFWDGWRWPKKLKIDKELIAHGLDQHD